MSKQWWKGKGEAGAGGASPTAAAEDSQTDVASSTQGAASTQFPSTEPVVGSASAAEFAATQVAPGMVKMTDGVPGGAPTGHSGAEGQLGFSTSQLFAVDAQVGVAGAVRHDPVQWSREFAAWIAGARRSSDTDWDSSDGSDGGCSGGDGCGGGCGGD